VCPEQGCNVKYTWNCFRLLKSHTRKNHGYDVVKVRKRRPLDQLKESTKRQYKYCPPKHYEDQKELVDGKISETTKLSPVIIDGQEYYICPKEGCSVKYTTNSFRQLKKHTEKEHALEVFKERKRRPIDQLKESTKRQYKYCPPKHYEDRVKIDDSGYFVGFQTCVKNEILAVTDVNTRNVQMAPSFLKVVNNVV
jgi:hypothetical protein